VEGHEITRPPPAGEQFAEPGTGEDPLDEACTRRGVRENAVAHDGEQQERRAQPQREDALAVDRIPQAALGAVRIPLGDVAVKGGRRPAAR
jgi:hypothetical protein